ncbi:MAG: YggT family protein [Acidobacteria bacterium]|nr:YggT family protein [Acidobacteriota bacterium]
MTILGANFLSAMAQILDMILQFMIVLIVVRAFISWVNPDPYNPIVRFLHSSTEPMLRPFRRFISPWKTGGIDFSPLIVIVLLVFIRILIVQSLVDWAFRIRGGRPL